MSADWPLRYEHVGTFRWAERGGKRSGAMAIRGGLPERALREIHRDELVANWARVQVPDLPQKIEPLP